LSRSYYDLLGVSPTAPADEIKRAFRREIAKYHPDKVQHLGQEFQDIAVSKAAELTLAYKTLTDEAARAEYDAQAGTAPARAPAGATGWAATPAAASTTPEAHRPYTPPPEPPAGGGSATFAQERAGATDLIRRATLARFRRALTTEFGEYQEVPVAGFEVACVPKPARFSLRQPPRVLARFVPRVDGPTMTESWSLAARMKKDGQRDTCVFVMGPAIASAGELAAAIAEQRRKPAAPAGKLILVPVSTQTWMAHVPTDAPPVVKTLLARLKSG